ncbi:MAG: class I SAM-dependent methyltransferase [Candidatus Limnocylindrales bacterium]
MLGRNKPYRGLPMEGVIARWYDRNTGRDLTRFRTVAGAIAGRVPSGGQILEVAPGPGFLAIELARRGYRVTGLDISRSFVRIATANAERAGVHADFVLGDVAHMPIPDASVDFVVCMAAFKNFSQPVRALDEVYRVLRPGGGASIFDMRKDASNRAIAAETATMGLSPVTATFTEISLRMLRRNAYTVDGIRQIAENSRFGGSEVRGDGIGFELVLRRA